MTKNSLKRFALLFLIISFAGLVSSVGEVRAADPADFANPAFYRVWQRTDKPVADGRTARSWLWAPQPFTHELYEDYQLAPGGKRLVQYFDKSRMEINNPGGDANSPFYVTNGLLVNEMMSGQLQLGDNRFENRAPSQRGVAGDDDDTNGPTYAALGRNTGRVGPSNGPVTTSITRDGQVSNNPGTTQFGVRNAFFVNETGHNIASVFWDFLGTNGVVYDSQDNPDTAQLFNPTFYATGFPVTEAFWARVKVAGQVKDVLVQAFERRVLTYTPSNPDGFKVEMGNVGRHYYQWRYGANPPGLMGAVPQGLKSNFMLGLGNAPNELGWMQGSGSPWDVRYQYLVGDALGNNWAQWNQPAGAFATYYMQDSAKVGYIPAFSYYVMQYSSPNAGNKSLSEVDRDLANLNNPGTMKAYFGNFKLLLDRVREFGKPVILHIEPDLWGFAHSKLVGNGSDDGAQVPAKVQGSGYGDVVGNLPDNLSGFARALVALRDKYAPNAIMALHVSPWAAGKDITTNTDPNLDVNGLANRTASFIKSLGTRFDLLFYDVADRDAAFKARNDNAWYKNWWDINNNAFPNFNRYRDFMSQVNRAVGLRAVLWQVPVGNTLFRAVNNTPGHYQDNRVQYFLGDNYRANLQPWIDAGLIGILFGRGDGQQTNYTDATGDGVTNPAPVNGNNRDSAFADDDGGFLRLRAQDYYRNGPIPLP